MRRLVFVLCMFFWLMSAGAVFAHGVHWAVQQENIPVVQFTYAGGEPLSYASIKVFAPGEKKVEFQNGHADSNGCFAFQPLEDGEYSVIANDGMGHQSVAQVHWKGDAKGSAGAQESNRLDGFSFSLRILLGISLIANLAGGYWLMARRREGKENAHS